MKLTTMIVLLVLAVAFIAAYIYYPAQSQQLPVHGLGIRAKPSSGIAPLAVNLTAAGDYLDNHTIVKYVWNYGGSPIIETTSPAPRSYTFLTPGNYTVTLTVTTSSGETQSATKLIEVNTA